MSVYHHKSEPVHSLIAKGLHGVKGTQVDCEQNYLWQVTPTQESASASTAGSVLNFLVPASSMGLLTLWNDSFIEVKGYFNLAANLTLGTTATALTAATSCFLFSDVEVTMNGTVVRPQTGLTTPWMTFVDLALNEDKAYFDNRRYTQMLLMDSFNTTVATGGNAQSRTSIIAGTSASSATRPLSLIVPLRSLGIRTGDAIPPSTEIRIRITRNSDSALTWGADAGTTIATLVMSSCSLYTRQIRLSQEAASALSMSWQKEACRLNFQRVRGYSQAFPIGAQAISLNQVLPGPRPSRVVVAYILQTSIQNNAAANKNMMRPEAGQVFTNAYIQIGDARFYPVQSVTTATNATVVNTCQLGELYEMYASCCSTKDCALGDGDFSNQQLLCFNTSRSGDVSSVVDVSEECSIDFNAQMNIPATVAFSIMVFSWYHSCIEIDSSGAVTVDS